MARIYLALAAFATLLLASNLLVGLTLGDFGTASRRFQAVARDLREAGQGNHGEDLEVMREVEERRIAAGAQLAQQRRRFRPHIWLGISAALISLLVSSVSVTYFVGTSRWCREVVEAYGLAPELAERSQRLKRKSFPFALIGIAFILTIAGLGAAADPATLNPNAADWVAWHWGLAMTGVVVIPLCFLVQVSAIGANYEVIQEILGFAEVERQRRRESRERRAAAVDAAEP